jgi:purine-nucleoside phosphorylase
MDFTKVKESTEYVKYIIKDVPEIGVILGSGLGDLAEQVEDRILIPYSEIPNMPVSTVAGHAGRFVYGTLQGKKVIMMQGRFHYYEGYKMEALSLPVYVMKSLGVKVLIVTNAAGGVNTSFRPGELMLIKDHINFAFDNPLIGKNIDEIGPRFPDVSTVYDKGLLQLGRNAAENLKMNLQEGTYIMMSGPCYETPAEIRMCRALGADAVGMSTVPEVLSAAHAGVKVLGISCITNMAAGILNQPLMHTEVIETSNKVRYQFIALVSEIIKNINEV